MMYIDERERYLVRCYACRGQGYTRHHRIEEVHTIGSAVGIPVDMGYETSTCSLCEGAGKRWALAGE
jgi:DnaJ-class molecular chaperone